MPLNLGKAIPTRIAITAITINNSSIVKPFLLNILHLLSFYPSTRPEAINSLAQDKTLSEAEGFYFLIAK